MKITRDQMMDLIMALHLGNYFVEILEPTGKQYESDKETMAKAWEIIKQIEVTQ
jgi:hypothetical protein